ncbi:ATP-binding cassette domain-containing protein [Candidatus Bathyarchaeota archaeon]|nr:ABC transporter ATP-binding protein [Candidatus Bathyarchaeota archaeon]NIR16879.1 ABC transporter ATP-binding protein [Desulfobacterales bacterium]NIU81204.1 ATP-binding cassette domain-containing protein [Candidatus Bathyarchaeota archaeon]NIV67338.1 ATP-binding cassette domain-containing protein [Candidatus Bathyarchaeota archaeon]NIW15893.1 ATP-binding cassette domain-containing protein [Candidatus Bathyarchaeota archaeon]
MPLVEIQNLVTYFEILRGYVKAVDDVSFQMSRGEAFGLAGESGCGKTTTALSLLRLLPPNGRVMDGKIIFNGRNLLEMDDEEYRKEIRWKRMSVISQGAMNALNPVIKVGEQIAEAIVLHEDVGDEEAVERAGKLLDLVGVGSERTNRYAHELSGGMKQRTIIAMALACNPDFIIADEPTTALDVIIEAQVLKVMKDLQKKLDLSMMVISHDLSMIAETCERIAIMYAGKIVEKGDIAAIYKEPLHPYTQKLIGAFPSIVGPKEDLTRIPGFPPDLLNPPPACRFHPRCPYAMDKCRREEPETVSVEGKDHSVACHLVG